MFRLSQRSLGNLEGVHYDYEGKRARVPPDIGAFQRNAP